MQSPITEFFDDEPIITPAKINNGNPISINKNIKTAVCTFLCDNIDKDNLQRILQDCVFINSVFGRSGKTPVYQYKDECLIVLMTVGSPVSVAVVEELHFLGIENIIAYGTAGLLDESISKDTFVLIEKAIRDEGASYHYLPPSMYVDTDAELTDFLEKYFHEKVKTKRGITWTTDAMYRETMKRKSRRMQQGAVVVEMECAGFAAACKRLGIRFAEFVYFSDILSDKESWGMLGNKNDADDRRSKKVMLLLQLIQICNEIDLHKIK